MADRDWLTYDMFEGRVGQPFALTRADGTRVELELVETTESDRPGGTGPDGEERLQFSVVFQGPAEPLVGQGTYTLRHAELGGLVVFLVPVGPAQYEAAFA